MTPPSFSTNSRTWSSRLSSADAHRACVLDVAETGSERSPPVKIFEPRRSGVGGAFVDTLHQVALLSGRKAACSCRFRNMQHEVLRLGGHGDALTKKLRQIHRTGPRVFRRHPQTLHLSIAPATAALSVSRPLRICRSASVSRSCQATQCGFRSSCPCTHTDKKACRSKSASADQRVSEPQQQTGAHPQQLPGCSAHFQKVWVSLQVEHVDVESAGVN